MLSLRSTLSLSLSLSLGVLVAACGDDAPPPDTGPDAPPAGCQTPLSMRLEPMKEGATWTYTITQPGQPEARNKTSSIGPLEDVGDRKAGTIAYRQTTQKLNSTVVSWQEDRCTSTVRHREKTYDLSDPPILQSDQFYTPSKLRVDESPEHLVAGAAWTLSYTEIHVDPTTHVATTIAKDENWMTVSLSESVTVPAGTFNAVHFNKKTSGNADKDYWFVAGVGKVKETGDQTEELTSYTIPN
ncbi:MAG TPA: hypothetical protein VHE35_25075 [Kofleriaceae bacterium]|nr:hypothetical protein [Kofleriaceae bacterium]